MSSDDRTTGLSGSEIKTELSYREDAIKSQNGRSLKSYHDAEEPLTVKGESESIQEPVLSQPKRRAKIHDFCFGIPYGGIILFGGFFGFIFSRNPASLCTVLAGTLLWRSIQTYLLTNKLLPSGFYAVISAAMLCFYSYVVLSGGNPPPKKKPSVAVQSS